MHVALDPLGGIAGDMFAASLVDARPALEAAVAEALAALILPEGIRAEFKAHGDGILRGRRFVVSSPTPPHSTPAAELRERIAAGGLDAAVRTRALDMLDLLSRAESRVHGIPAAEVRFHELGGWDTVVDLVAAAALIEALGAASWWCAPLPRGTGTVATAHGALPIPSPATALLLEGFVLVDDGLLGERVTPTGAAILCHLAPAQAPDYVPRRLIAGGHGFGSSCLEGRSNVLRAQLYEVLGGGEAGADRVAVIAFDVDDQTAEDLAVALDRLRALDGVLDVTQHPVVGKAGRVGARVQVLAAPAALDAVARACFAETSTIGLRWAVAERMVLAREVASADFGDRAVGVKMVRRPGGARTAKAEAADLAEAGDRARREALRRAAEERALGIGNDGDGERTDDGDGGDGGD